MIDNEIRYLSAQSLAGREIKAEMYPSEDSTQRRFFIRGEPKYALCVRSMAFTAS